MEDKRRARFRLCGKTVRFDCWIMNISGWCLTDSVSLSDAVFLIVELPTSRDSGALSLLALSLLALGKRPAALRLQARFRH